MNVSDSTTVEDVKSEVLSLCTWELMKEGGGNIYQRSYDPIRKKWFIIAEFTTLIGGGNGDYRYSVSFEDISTSKSHVEIRSLKTIWGGNQVSLPKIFEKIKQCKNALLNHTS
jgi:hypothetical protein